MDTSVAQAPPSQNFWQSVGWPK